MRRQRQLYLLLSVGIIITVSSVVLLSIYATDYSYSHELIKFGEFWGIARSGGGLSTANQSDLYVKSVPLSAGMEDLRVFNLEFSVNASEEPHLWVPVQFISALSMPTMPIIATPWIDSWSGHSDELALVQQGLRTPHNITVSFYETSLTIAANDTIYVLSLGCTPYKQYTERNWSTSGGFASLRVSGLDLLSDSSILFHLADDNSTVVNLRMNSDGAMDFSILARWNISFEQKYGAGLRYSGNSTIAHWTFKNAGANITEVSIIINNTNYYSPIVPAYTMMLRTPWLEVGMLVVGLVIVGVAVVYMRRLEVQRS